MNETINIKRQFYDSLKRGAGETYLIADRLFNAISKEGEIKLPISDQFWGSYYGVCLDKFGVNWKISFSSETA